MSEINKIVKAIKKARFVFVCGNGGSSATAEHFSNDLFSRGIKAICLNSNTSIMTMIANDYGYQYVFSKQLKLFASKKDLLIVFSVSGTSPNIVEALKFCPNIKVFGKKGESYAEAENRHLILAHAVTTALGEKNI